MTSFKDRLSRGYYAVDYRLLDYPKKPSRENLAEWLKTDRPHHTGWPPFIWLSAKEHKPQVIDEDTYRATIIAEKMYRPHYERWQASAIGNFTLLRAHEIDYSPDYSGKRVVALTVPARRIAEILLHSERMARRFDAKEIDFSLNFTGLRGRELISLPESNRHLSRGYSTHASEYKRQITLDVDSVDSGVAEITDRLMRPFYSLFEFTLPAQFCEQEVADLRSNRF